MNDWLQAVDRANRHARSAATNWPQINSAIDRGLTLRQRRRRLIAAGSVASLAIAAAVAGFMLKPESRLTPAPIEPAAPFTKTSVQALEDECRRSLTGGTATESVSAPSHDKSVAVALVRNDSTALMCMRTDANSNDAYVHDLTINPTPKDGADVEMSTVRAPNSDVYVAAIVIPKVAFVARTYGDDEPAQGTKEARRSGGRTLALNVLTFKVPPPEGSVDLSVFWFPDKEGKNCGCEEILTTFKKDLASIPIVQPNRPIP